MDPFFQRNSACWLLLSNVRISAVVQHLDFHYDSRENNKLKVNASTQKREKVFLSWDQTSYKHL